MQCILSVLVIPLERYTNTKTLLKRRNEMKKLLIGLFMMVTLLVMVACGQAETETTNEPTKVVETIESTDKVETVVMAEPGDYVPEQDIEFVVPYDAGGNSDIPARVFAKYMSKYASVDVKVVNIVGSGGRVGAKEVQKADPDGTKLIMQPVGYPMQYALGVADFTYMDFEPVGQWLDSTLAVVVSAESPYETMEDLFAAAKANPETIKMGSVTGTLPLFATLELEKQGGVTFHKVDLSGASKAPELLGGRIDGYIDGFGAIKQYIDGGQFRCLGIISDVEVVGYEYLDTFEELGFNNFLYLKQAFGLWAPKGTPSEAVEYINGLIAQAAADPECIEELNKLAYSPAHSSVEDYAKAMEVTYKAFEEAASAITGK